MRPVGPDSVDGLPPQHPDRLHRDRLLELANKNAAIRLVPERFDPSEHQGRLAQEHVLAICEGGRSRTREHYRDRFGAADASIYSLDGDHLQDVVLGLRVNPPLSDQMSVLLTVFAEQVSSQLAARRGLLEHAAHREEAET